MKVDLLALIKQPKKKKTSKIDDTKSPLIFLDRFFKPSVISVMVCMALAVIIASLIAPKMTVLKYNYRPGDISKHNIRASQDFSVEDTESTAMRRLEKAESVHSIYDFNSSAEEEIAKRISVAFSAMRETLSAIPAENTEVFNEEHTTGFENLLKIRVDTADFNLLQKRDFKKEIEDFFLDLVLPFAQREVIISKEQLFKDRGRGIVLRDIYTNEEIMVDDFSSLIDVKEAKILLKRKARKNLSNVRSDVRNTIINLCSKLIEPTVTFNKVATTDRRTEAMQEVSPLYYRIKKGEIIIREGAKISDSTMVKLKALMGLKREKSVFWVFAGYFLFCFLALLILYRYAMSNLNRNPITRITKRDSAFLCTTLILSFLLIKFCVMSAETFSKGYQAVPMESCFYAVPFAFAAIVISVALSPQIAALSSIVISMFFCFLLDTRFTFFIYSFLSCLVAAKEVAQCKDRKTIIRAGLIVGGVNACLILSLYLIKGTLFNTETIISLGFGMVSGILSGVLASGIIPIFEILFNYTTSIKLLELADLNQPVLRKLLISAPGTYHHSILVGVLAEAAAEAINANSLLARVSSYYHDIGKMKKPLYFVENQQAGENKHNKLLPSMSSLIIVSHVKDGVEIATKYRLGKSIQDIISQHHGTSCINYFYHKAKDIPDINSQSISDKDFRYPGPRPQTKEAGIVMLADAVEATSKTLSDPTPARIQGTVQRIINNIFTDGQLDECELTLKDLHLIADNFTRILNGIFHSRIEYPEKNEKDRNGRDLDKKSAKTDTDPLPNDSANSERDLGRIGIAKPRNKHFAAG